MPRTLVQIVPPGEGGVLDYAECLKAQWMRLGKPSRLLALSEPLAKQASLAQRMGNETTALSVVLHFSGYGYARRGLCGWLLEELSALRKQRQSALRLVVVFHELFASGPPWRSAFWVGPAQATIAENLARMADAIWTNTERHAAWLHSRTVNPQAMQVRPVFSNIGEPDAMTPRRQRLPQAVVFGSRATRQRAFDGLAGLAHTLKALGVQRLIDVGEGEAVASGRSAIACQHVGRLEALAVGQLLRASRFGLIDYASQELAKSGVFAAYAAHGCVVINTHKPGLDADGLRAGIDYINLRQAISNADDGGANVKFAVVASNVTRWYEGHRLSDQAHGLWELARPALKAGVATA